MSNFKISNLQPDLLDNRDLIFEANITELPSKVDNRIYAGEIEDQLQTGSCVANATVSSLELLTERNGDKLDFSRMFLYYNLREPYSELKEKDSGAYLRDGFKMCNKQGLCEEKYWEFIQSNVNIKPTQEAYDKANQYKVLEYKRIVEKNSSTINYLKCAVLNGYPIIIALTLDKSFYYLNKNLQTQNYTGTNKTEDIIGSHAMSVVGYDDELKGFIVENSWGIYWGEKGFCLIPYDVMLKDCHDIWICTGFNEYKFDAKYVPPKLSFFQKVKQFFKNYKENKGTIIFWCAVIFAILTNISLFF